MITRFVIEGIVIVALIIGFCFEEKIARAERNFLKKLLRKRAQKREKQESINRRLREIRYIMAQREREKELIELGLDPRPSLQVIKKSNGLAPTYEEEVA